jgi:predicted CxxxxCH...CXXCH cytochrome family protein
MFPERRPRHWLLAVLLSLMVASALPSCLEPRERPESPHQDNCTTCHGSPAREGDPLTRSAPPVDLSGSTDPRRPSVGAHLVHLLANEVHGGVACRECHVVPQATDDPGHADSAGPAEVTFGALARHEGRSPRYLAAEHRCADTYCHREAEPNWVPSEQPAPRCERCHGMPPPPPHPQSNACERCHGEVVGPLGTIITPSRHVDGIVDVSERCDSCHGSGPLGAPPPDLAGQTDPSSLGVGAHALHLAGGVGRPVACDACHEVPETVGAPGHLGPPPAEVLFSGIAVVAGRMPSWSRDSRRCADSWCHGPSAPGGVSPIWTAPSSPSCTSCHGMPPPPPHPQMPDCVRCHGEVIDASGLIVAVDRHIDGVVDVALPVLCNACHGDATGAAPPVDLAGNVATTFPGVGAHRAHLEGSGIARKVLCQECHQVPATVLATGHIDTPPPAEVLFSGVAKAFGASPSYQGGTCTNTYCHGDDFIFGHESGGAVTQPIWTVVDGSQKQCNSCHGLPPPPPHPPGPAFCSDCHTNFGITLQVLDPDSHVNGMVDF